MPIWHKTENDFLIQQKRDEALRNYCKQNGIILIEIKYDENIENYLNNIL